MDAETILKQCIAELHEQTEVANRKAARLREGSGHESHLDHAEGVAAGLQQALDHISKRVLANLV